MVMETADDLNALFDINEFGKRFYIGSGEFVVGVLDNNFDQSIDINGRRTGLRCPSEAVADVLVGGQITDVDAAAAYTVREKESGERTTLLILERA